VLFTSELINSAGAGLVFPFLSLYLSRQLNFSMTDVGVFFGLYAVISTVSQLAGGSLVDRIGRKPVMLFSMFGNALAMLGFGLGGSLMSAPGALRLLVIGVIITAMGLTGAAFGPAVNAMVADLVESQKRSEAYGLLRVVQNLGVAIGPAVGGLIATHSSYLVLFVISALASAVYGLMIVLFIRETLPKKSSQPGGAPVVQPSAPVAPGGAGFLDVLRDRVFMLFTVLCLAGIVTYSQMTTTLPVYLNRSFGVSEQWFGLLMSLNAGMVVLLQFPITRITSRYSRSLMMAVGAALYAVGFGVFAVTGALPFFFLAQAVLTSGEMITVPVMQAFVADIAPEHMRGRYMSIAGLAYTAGYGLGPMLGGMVMDRLGGQYIWYGSFVLCLLLALGFLAMSGPVKKRLSAAVQRV
jgi:MFS family permease